LYVIPFSLRVQEGPGTAAEIPERSAATVPAWSRSVGSMKCQLSGLVRPKATAQSSLTDRSTTAAHTDSATRVNNADSELAGKSSSENNRPNASEYPTSGSNVVSTGLAGLGAYSSSSGSENGNGSENGEESN